MKKLRILLIAIFCITITACTNPVSNESNQQGESIMYEQITPQQAKKLMETESDYMILDVREQDEFDEGHVEGAILIPYAQINAKAEELLPDHDQLILVYCRSGRRSKIAAESLVNLGYTNVKEFGGIIDWPYEVVK